MKRSIRYGLLALAAVLVLAVASPALATEDHGGGGEEEVTTTTVADPFAGGDTPAIVIPPPEPVEDDQPWTSRFIYPTIVIGTIVLIVGITIGYNRSIRNRYKVVAD